MSVLLSDLSINPPRLDTTSGYNSDLSTTHHRPPNAISDSQRPAVNLPTPSLDTWTLPSLLRALKPLIVDSHTDQDHASGQPRSVTTHRYEPDLKIWIFGPYSRPSEQPPLSRENSSPAIACRLLKLGPPSVTRLFLSFR